MTHYVKRMPLSGINWSMLKAHADFVNATDPLLVGDPNATPNEFAGLKKVRIKR